MKREEESYSDNIAWDIIVSHFRSLTDVRYTTSNTIYAGLDIYMAQSFPTPDFHDVIIKIKP